MLKHLERVGKGLWDYQEYYRRRNEEYGKHQSIDWQTASYRKFDFPEDQEWAKIGLSLKYSEMDNSSAQSESAEFGVLHLNEWGNLDDEPSSGSELEEEDESESDEEDEFLYDDKSDYEDSDDDEHGDDDVEGEDADESGVSGSRISAEDEMDSIAEMELLSTGHCHLV